MRGSFFAVLSEIARRGCGRPLATWCRNGFHAVLPPGWLPGRQQLTQVDTVAGGVLVEGADRRGLPVHRGLKQ